MPREFYNDRERHLNSPPYSTAYREGIDYPVGGFKGDRRGAIYSRSNSRSRSRSRSKSPGRDRGNFNLYRRESAPRYLENNPRDHILYRGSYYEDEYDRYPRDFYEYKRPRSRSPSRSPSPTAHQPGLSHPRVFSYQYRSPSRERVEYRANRDFEYDRRDWIDERNYQQPYTEGYSRRGRIDYSRELYYSRPYPRYSRELDYSESRSRYLPPSHFDRPYYYDRDPYEASPRRTDPYRRYSEQRGRPRPVDSNWGMPLSRRKSISDQSDRSVQGDDLCKAKDASIAKVTETSNYPDKVLPTVIKASSATENSSESPNINCNSKNGATLSESHRVFEANNLNSKATHNTSYQIHNVTTILKSNSVTDHSNYKISLASAKQLNSELNGHENEKATQVISTVTTYSNDTAIASGNNSISLANSGSNVNYISIIPKQATWELNSSNKNISQILQVSHSPSYQGKSGHINSKSPTVTYKPNGSIIPKPACNTPNLGGPSYPNQNNHVLNRPVYQSPTITNSRITAIEYTKNSTYPYPTSKPTFQPRVSTFNYRNTPPATKQNVQPRPLHSPNRYASPPSFPNREPNYETTNTYSRSPSSYLSNFNESKIYEPTPVSVPKPGFLLQYEEGLYPHPWPIKLETDFAARRIELLELGTKTFKTNLQLTSSRSELNTLALEIFQLDNLLKHISLSSHDS